MLATVTRLSCFECTTGDYMSNNQWIDRLIAIFTLLMVAVGFGVLLHARAVQSRPLAEREPQSVDGAVGKNLASLPVLNGGGVVHRSLLGSAHLVYVFATTCGFCEAQHAYMASVLSKLSPGTVVSVSEEPAERAANYWVGFTTELPRPLGLVPGTLSHLGITGTPALLFVSPDGRITAAYLGTTLSWPVERFQEELRVAAASSVD